MCDFDLIWGLAILFLTETIATFLKIKKERIIREIIITENKIIIIYILYLYINKIINK